MSSDQEKKISDESEIGTLSNNLRALMVRFNVDASELSKKTGIALTTVNGLKRGHGNPTLSTLQQLADFFNVSIGELAEKNLSRPAQSNRVVYEIPLLLPDELPEFLNSDLKKYKNTISTELESWKDSKYFAIKIINNAMQPLFEKGSIFVIAKDITVHDGDIALVQFDNHIPCFRRVFIEGQSYFFKPVAEIINNNNLAKPPDHFTIHGIVIKAIQHFHG